MTKKPTFEFGIVVASAALLSVVFRVLFNPPDWAAAGFMVFTMWMMMLKIGQEGKG